MVDGNWGAHVTIPKWVLDTDSKDDVYVPVLPPFLFSSLLPADCPLFFCLIFIFSNPTSHYRTHSMR